MKTLGIQLKSTEAILVVLEMTDGGEISQSFQSTKLKISDPTDNVLVRQFRDQINAAFETIAPDKIGVLARNYKAKGTRAPSAISFKLEGIIQLNVNYPISFVWPQTIAAFQKKNEITMGSNKKFEADAFNVAYYLMYN